MPRTKRLPEVGDAPARRLFVTKVAIDSYRSIAMADVDLSRTTIVVGANGSGKTNLLEAIAIAAASAANKLDHEFLFSRGIRPLASSVSRFPDSTQSRADIAVHTGTGAMVSAKVSGDDLLVGAMSPGDNIQREFTRWLKLRFREGGEPKAEDFIATLLATIKTSDLDLWANYVIYSPDYASLRSFSDEGQILPLGVHGEGLFRHLVELTRDHPDVVREIGEHLKVLDWFDGFVLPDDLGPGEKRLAIRDRYLAENVLLDQRSANEGFLFLLFIYTLMLSPSTPRFFAIDNADTSLNPRLCAHLVKDIARLAREHDRQVILTTHNPAMLDGLNLADNEQRLLVCERDMDGHTRFTRIPAPQRPHTSLAEAFLRGYLGGVPVGF